MGRNVRTRQRAPPTNHAKLHVDVIVRAGRGGLVAVVCRDDGENYLGITALVVQGVDDPFILRS